MSLPPAKLTEAEEFVVAEAMLGGARVILQPTPPQDWVSEGTHPLARAALIAALLLDLPDATVLSAKLADPSGLLAAPVLVNTEFDVRPLARPCAKLKLVDAPT